MSCQHRFYSELVPQQKPLKFLIIGTFNPSWDATNNNNASYFYGRSTNLFWCICPHAFNDNCLVDKRVNEWKEFCSKHNIGLTDIIREVTNAEKGNLEHEQLLTSFEDKNLDIKHAEKYVFDIEFNTKQINNLISESRAELKGVFFTRMTFNGINRIENEWRLIKSLCEKLNIYSAALPTPSVRVGGIKDKIQTWRHEIQNCM
jgi:hypothetical protein